MGSSIDKGRLASMFNMHRYVLHFLNDDHSKTKHEELSFECGVLAALDWVKRIPSVYAELIEKDMEGFTNGENNKTTKIE